jgi:homogentisate phytyltransferase/homogentisate geranylgeranyltransferase
MFEDVRMTTTTATETATLDTSFAQMGALRAFWEFCRPHTIIGTTLAVWVFYALASSAAGHHDLVLVLLTWAASLSVNVYIVGINQVTDVDIDRINKPYLPLASGAFSMATGKTLCAVFGALSLLLSAIVGPWLLATIGIVFGLGTAYSLPPLRLKRFPLFAASAITLARAIVGNIGVYLTYSYALSGEASLPAFVLAFVAFMFLFVIVIALMKDVPDIEGDRRHQISTFVVSLGATKVMMLCRLILTVAYVGMIVAGLWGLPGVHPLITVGTHAAALVALWALSLKSDDENPDEAYRYYMHIWKLFYFEFASFPVAVLLAG